jgi:hypothetical protein
VVKHNNNDDEMMMMIPTVYCIDTSTEMAVYAQQVLHDEIDYRTANNNDNNDDEDIIQTLDKEMIQQKFIYQIADMRNFTLPPSPLSTPEQSHPPTDHHPTGQVVDTVWILLGSLQHMLTNTDVINCFQCIYNVLPSQNGTVFIELPHPRESTFNIMECTRNGWKVPLVEQPSSDQELNYIDDDDDDDDDYGNDDETDNNTVMDGGELSIVWGDDGDAFDPITQIRQFSIRFQVTGMDRDINATDTRYPGMEGTTLEQVVPMRLFTAQEIDALARCAGLEVVAMYGALEHDVDVNDEEASYRLVCALQKRSR